jgi:hypothetical protein
MKSSFILGRALQPHALSTATYVVSDVCALLHFLLRKTPPLFSTLRGTEPMVLMLWVT